MITTNDRAELRLFEMFLKRRAEQPDEDLGLAYAEVYGEVVFDDEDARCKLCGGLGPGHTCIWDGRSRPRTNAARNK